MRNILSLFLLLSLLLAFAGCTHNGGFNQRWMIGKTSEQIQDRYGVFDGHPKDTAEDGLFKDCICCYYLNSNSKQLFGDPEPLECLYIEFDENGIAYNVYIFTVPGG